MGEGKPSQSSAAAAVLQQGYREYPGDTKGAHQAPEHNIDPLLRAGVY